MEKYMDKKLELYAAKGYSDWENKNRSIINYYTGNMYDNYNN